jgi:hypothetical protein
MSFKFVTGDNQGIIYAINQAGDLLFYRDLARNGTANWAFNGVGQAIGTGWSAFTELFSGGLGIIYAISPEGSLLYYQDQAQNGTARWAYNGQGQRIGSGWTVERLGAGTLHGYCVPLSAPPGELLNFKLSAPHGCTVRYLLLERQPNGSPGVLVRPP